VPPINSNKTLYSLINNIEEKC